MESDTQERFWTGTVGQRDDFGADIEDTFIDGATVMGPWAIMTPSSHAVNGCGIGTGRGQRYERQEDGRWKKTAG